MFFAYYKNMFRRMSLSGWVLGLFVAGIALKMYFESDAFNLKCIVSDVDGNKYCVRERAKLQLAADLLANTTQKLRKLVAYLGKTFPERANCKRLVDNFDPQTVKEILPTSEYTAYSENKGEKLAFCTTTTKKGDKLIVSVTADKFVNKGSGRPVFKQNYRMELLSSLECVDYVCLSNYPSGIEVLKKIKPDFYVKGQDYKNTKQDSTGKINLEKNIVEKNGGKIIFTDVETFSSSKIINNNLSFNFEQKKFFP